MQLDLFRDYVPPEGEVVPFPMARRAAVVRSIAGQLLRCRSQVHADRLWRLEVRRWEAELFNRGMAQDAIRAEILAFKIAVEREMLARQGTRSNPGGGAA
jgi:hypothetical protein